LLMARPNGARPTVGIGDRWSACGSVAESSRRWAASLATYLTDRQPLPTSEPYDLLTAVDFATLTAELARATGRPLHVRYIHDGTAAAGAVDTTGSDGIIVVGTSLGAGFPLPDQPRL